MLRAETAPELARRGELSGDGISLQLLDCHVAIEDRITGIIDCSHAARSEQPDYPVAIVEDLSQQTVPWLERRLKFSP